MRFGFLFFVFCPFMAIANSAFASGIDSPTAEMLFQELESLEENATYPTDQEIEAFLAEFYEAYNTAKEKEQSYANRMLGGLAIGAAAVGGIQTASAIAEQNADTDAERDMAAYLATFHCNYGGGKNIKYGETDVELPGGNDLIALYTEYINLANDLKIRKAALGMRPGVESEPILESATSGLYDDVSTGKTSGVYASLARALQNPDGPDAAAWATQKETSAQKQKTGTTIGGIGMVGATVADLKINHTDIKESKVSKPVTNSTKNAKKINPRTR